MRTWGANQAPDQMRVSNALITTTAVVAAMAPHKRARIAFDIGICICMLSMWEMITHAHTPNKKTAKLMHRR